MSSRGYPRYVLLREKGKSRREQAESDMSFQALVQGISAHPFVLVRRPSPVSVGWEIHSSHGDSGEGSQYLPNTNIPYSSIFSAFCSVSLDSQTSRRGHYRWCLQFLTSYSLFTSRQWLLLWPLHLVPSCQGQQCHPCCQRQWMCFHPHLTFSIYRMPLPLPGVPFPFGFATSLGPGVPSPSLTAPLHLPQLSGGLSKDLAPRSSPLHSLDSVAAHRVWNSFSTVNVYC